MASYRDLPHCHQGPNVDRFGHPTEAPQTLHELRQLGDAAGNAPCLIAREHIGSGAWRPAELQAAGATSLRAIAAGLNNDESRQLAAEIGHPDAGHKRFGTQGVSVDGALMIDPLSPA
jgi:hypothetical protein